MKKCSELTAEQIQLRNASNQIELYKQKLTQCQQYLK